MKYHCKKVFNSIFQKWNQKYPKNISCYSYHQFAVPKFPEKPADSISKIFRDTRLHIPSNFPKRLKSIDFHQLFVMIPPAYTKNFDTNILFPVYQTPLKNQTSKTASNFWTQFGEFLMV